MGITRRNELALGGLSTRPPLLRAFVPMLMRGHARTALQNRTMTLRERDTTEQRIGGIDDVVAAVVDLVGV
jgi:hypothetical protein